MPDCDRCEQLEARFREDTKELFKRVTKVEKDEALSAQAIENLDDFIRRHTETIDATAANTSRALEELTTEILRRRPLSDEEADYVRSACILTKNKAEFWVGVKGKVAAGGILTTLVAIGAIIFTPLGDRLKAFISGF